MTEDGGGAAVVVPAAPPAAVVVPHAVLRGIGIDSGFAKTGVAGVALVDRTHFVSMGGRVVTTEPEHRKGLRVSTDDVRRTLVFFRAFLALIEKIKPHVIGLEDYHVYDSADASELIAETRKLVRTVEAFADANAFAASILGGTWDLFQGQIERVKAKAWAGSETVQLRGRGKAAKTLMVNSAAICAAEVTHTPLFVFMPADRNKHFVGRARASKEEVEAGVRRMVAKVDEEIAARVKAKGMRNHCYDASALAVLALKEYSTYHQGETSTPIILDATGIVR